MKTIKGIAIAILVIFCYSSCLAQQAYTTPSQWIAEHKVVIDTTKYIFEAIVTNLNHYKSRKGEPLTCNVMQITKIFKGNPQLKLGNIKVITFGENISEGGGGPLVKDDTYIIIGRIADSYMQVEPMIATDNNIVITQMGCDGPIYFAHKYIRNGKVLSNQAFAARWDETQYKILDSLYSFFKENGLTVQEEVDETKQK
jgi:hypothetical protein